MTLIEKIINKKTCVIKKNQYAIVDVDFVMGHDGTAPLIIEQFRELKLKVWNPEKVLMVFDHFAPAATAERATIAKKLFDFTQKNNIPYSLSEGICHQLLLEHQDIFPGSIVVGADSHTTTIGALGSLAFGIGAKDLLYVLASGKIWLRIPETIRVELQGDLQKYVMGKDIALHLFTLFKPGELLNKSIEFIDSTRRGIEMDSRATICNMVTDLGACAGLFVPDDITQDYCDTQGKTFFSVQPDKNADYEKKIIIDVSSIDSLVALPHSPFNIRRVKDVKDQISFQQVYVGSCTGGRIEDVNAIVKLIKGKKVKKNLKKIFVPASNSVLSYMLENNLLEIFLEASITVCNASCGPCGSIDKGLLGNDEHCLSTANRNYQGRMGAHSASVYLASTYTAASAMLTGILKDPTEI